MHHCRTELTLPGVWLLPDCWSDNYSTSSFLNQLKDKDIEGADFIVLYAVQSIYITGNVVTEQKYLNTLKVRQQKEIR